jgi:hypothetical protein
VAVLSYVAGGVLLDRTSAPVTFMLADGLGTLATAVTAVALALTLRSARAQVPSTSA